MHLFTTFCFAILAAKPNSSDPLNNELQKPSKKAVPVCLIQTTLK